MYAAVILVFLFIYLLVVFIIGCIEWVLSEFYFFLTVFFLMQPLVLERKF